nr:PQQ-binding-like beta-propeller repeat protein [uncultured Actinoplanes sp.]
MALIELDLTTQPDQAAGIPPARRYRLPGLLLAVLLLLVLGGAAPAVPMLWQPAGLLPPIGDDGPFVLDGGRIYTVTSARGTRTATAWQLGPQARKLWSASFPAHTAGPDDVGYSRIDAERAGDVVLLSDGPSTTVLDARTGRVRWSVPVPVTPVGRLGVGVTQLQQFRPGTIYDQDSGEPGSLYFSSTGQPHTEPPRRTEVRGVDLATGATVWSVPESGSVNVLAAPHGVPEVLILSSGRLELRDARTGKLRRQVALAPVGGERPAGGELVDGALLVSYGLYGGQEIAYDPGTLGRLWARPVPEVLLDPPSCADVLCYGGRASLDVLDPATGRARWRAPDDVDLSRRAGYVIEADSRSGLLRRLVDPATGRTRVDLGGWRAEAIGPAGPAEGPILLRGSRGRDRSVVGVVLPRRDAVQPLGEIGTAVADCTADTAYVVCRIADGLRIWAYRA